MADADAGAAVVADAGVFDADINNINNFIDDTADIMLVKQQISVVADVEDDDVVDDDAIISFYAALVIAIYDGIVTADVDDDILKCYNGVTKDIVLST